MANQKKLYYVAVFVTDSWNSIRYVTKIEGRTAFWEKGKPAKAFKKSTADDIVFGLCMNSTPSATIYAYDFLEPFNEGDEENETE